MPRTRKEQSASVDINLLMSPNDTHSLDKRSWGRATPFANDLEYIECSAKNDNNIDKIFMDIVEKIDLKVHQNKIELRKYGSFKEVHPSKYESGKPPSKCCIIS